MTPRRAINGWKRPRSWPGRATSTAGTTRTRFAIVKARNPPLTGEPLRGRVDPSVNELITRRIREFDPPDGPCRLFDVHKANRLAELLAAWDPRGAAPTLKDRVGRCAALLRVQAPREPALHRLVVEIPVFTELRVRGGDATAPRRLRGMDPRVQARQRQLLCDGDVRDRLDASRPSRDRGSRHRRSSKNPGRRGCRYSGRANRCGETTASVQTWSPARCCA